ncbi:hypothetical protein [Chondromyces crocatus]|uniref:EF-hand domain-containing protein n=1 Tax=Chondromyces crocatus TaxID=52 RepID=A0A0K1EJP5_CHOCO|nr:hypothetical protein [Chondromyces crocatus]AKT41081.1 uncharacterized protein CMC5_052400 [Chondromyces crocatus]
MHPDHPASPLTSSRSSKALALPCSAARWVRSVLPLAACVLTGCLPGDTRPVPESFYVSVEPSEALRSGFDTDDGWHITFDRLVAAVGNIDFMWEDTSCNTYAEARYDRLFDFTRIEREKVGTAYGIGTCRVEFRLRSPSLDTILGAGVTQKDVETMRQRGTDRFATDEQVSVMVTGRATREGVEKRFDWRFRRSYEMSNCKAEEGGFITTVELSENGASEMRLELRAEELFRVTAEEESGFHFQPLADADTDGDGAVTFDELSKVEVTPGPLGGTGGEGGGTGGGLGSGAGQPSGPIGPIDIPGTPATLESQIYVYLLPRILRVAGGGTCEIEHRDSYRR